MKNFNETIKSLSKEIEWRTSRRIKLLGGIDTKDLIDMNEHLSAMVAVNKKLLAALEEIARHESPFDKTGEPLQVRIAKDLTRRIQIAKDAL